MKPRVDFPNRESQGQTVKIGRSDLIMMKIITISLITSNNQRLGNAGDTDQRSKRFCSNAVLCAGFT